MYSRKLLRARIQVERFLEKATKNDPLEAYRKQQAFLDFKNKTEDIIAEQITFVKNNLSDIKIWENEDLQKHQIEVIISNYLDHFMPTFKSKMDYDTVYNNFYGSFNWSVRAAYKRIGVKLLRKSVDYTVDFELTNQHYLDALHNDANYLLNTKSTAYDQTTKDRLINIVRNGRLNRDTIDEVASDLADQVEGISSVRSFMIANTETAGAFGTANQAFMTENDVPEKEWIIAGPHDLVDECDDNADASPINTEDEFPSGDMNEPAHTNCILPGQEVETAGPQAKIVATYQGPAIKLTFRSGKTLSVTPNHLVATRGGWVCTSKLNHGDYVISTDSLIKQMASTLGPNIEPVKAMIENIVVSPRAVSRRVKAASVNFNGDEAFCEDVNVISLDSKLLNDLKPGILERLGQYIFSWGDMKLSLLACLSSSNKRLNINLSTFSGYIGSPSKSFALRDIHIGIHDNSGLSVVPNSDTRLYKAFSKRHAGNTSNWSKFLERFAGFISFDEVIDIAKFNFSGHVYDLTVPYNFYTTNSIITHNCECLVNGVGLDLTTMSDEELGSLILWDGS